MGDHFVLLMDRLLTESTLGAAIESRNRSMQATTSDKDEASHRIDFGDVLCPGKMVECRICQDEDEDRNMETPCSCCGSLKYAHRKCVQRWCNEKGDTICEICHQPFKPDYTAPPPLFHFGRIPMNFRGNWEVYRRETPNGPRLIAMVSTDRNFAEPRLPEDSASMTRSILHCRSIAAIFMMLLILRHTLPVLVAETIDEFSFSTLTLLVLRIAGIVSPIYIIIKILNLTSVQRHQYQQVVPAPAPALSPSSSFSSISDEETEDSTQLHDASFTAS